MKTDLPNLIILCSDEMRADCLGYMGNPDIKTPNLDRFARRKAAVFASVVADLQQQLIEWCLRTDTDRPHEPIVGA
jgi:hypothetical protein